MDENKEFIPLSIELSNTGKSSYFFSVQKGIAMALALLPSALWIPYIATVTKSFIGLLFAFISYAIAYVFFLRFVILEETTWKKIFRNLENNKISGPAQFWGVDRKDEGVIHYKYSGGSSLNKAVVIKLVLGSKLGQPPTFDFEYKEVLREILWHVLDEELDVDFYTLLERNTVPRNIQKMYEDLEKIKDKNAKIIVKKHVQNLAVKSKYGQRMEVTYMVLHFNKPSHFKHMAKHTDAILNLAKKSGYFKICDLANKEEIERLVITHLGIRTIPTSVDATDINSFKTYGEVIRLFDEYGNEEWLEGDRDIEDEILDYLENKIDTSTGNAWETDIEDMDELEKSLDKKEEAKKEREKRKKMHMDKFKGISEKIGLVLIGKNGELEQADAPQNAKPVTQDPTETKGEEQKGEPRTTSTEANKTPKDEKSDLDIYLDLMDAPEEPKEIDLDNIFGEEVIDLDDKFGGGD